MQVLFEASGVIRVDTVAQLLDVATLLAHQPLPSGRRVAVVGNSSAMGLLVADACAARGLEPAGAPVDVGADGTAADFAAAVRTVVVDPSVDALVVVFVPPLVTGGAEVARVLGEVTAGWERPVVTTFLGSEGVPEQLQRRSGTEVQRGSIPSYPSPERAVLALSLAARYAEWRHRPAGCWATVRQRPCSRRTALSCCRRGGPVAGRRRWLPPMTSGTRSRSSPRSAGCGTAPTSAVCG